MSSEFLDGYICDAADELGYRVPDLLNESVWRDAKRTMFCFRKFGTCRYLYEGLDDMFFDAMHRSSGALLHYLQNAPEADKRTSKCEAIFDAIAGGFWEGARQIAQVARQTCHFDYEYEEDFLYVHFLLSYFFRDESAENCQQLLDHYANVIQGSPDVRLDICQAFLNKDEAAFQSHIIHFITQYRDVLNHKIDRETVPEEEWSWSKYVCIELLALLQLARRLGFKTESCYALAPEVLCYRPEQVFDAHYWQSAMPEVEWCDEFDEFEDELDDEFEE